MWFPRFLRRRPSITTFIPFLCVVLLWNLSFGGLKFLIKNLTVNHLAMAPGLLLERVVGYLSVGCVIAFLIGGCVCHSMGKRSIVFLTALIAVLALLFEYKFGLSSEITLVFTSIVLGFCFGLFSVARTVISCYEIERTGLRDTSVNGIVMLIVITATLVGAFVSARLFELVGVQTLWIFLGFFALIAMFSFWLRYGDQEEILPIRESVARVRKEFSFIVSHRHMILIPSAGLWAISMIVSIKSIPYAEHAYGIRESVGSLVLMASAVGAVAGNALTLFMPRIRRWFWFRVATYSFASLVVLFPVLTQTFHFMLLYSLLLGVAMGAATNLIDSAYLEFIAEKKVKENGAALCGIALNVLIASLLGFLHILPPVWHFVVLGAVAVGMGFFVLFTLHVLNGELKE